MQRKACCPTWARESVRLYGHLQPTAQMGRFSKFPIRPRAWVVYPLGAHRGCIEVPKSHLSHVGDKGQRPTCVGDGYTLTHMRRRTRWVGIRLAEKHAPTLAVCFDSSNQSACRTSLCPDSSTDREVANDQCLRAGLCSWPPPSRFFPTASFDSSNKCAGELTLLCVKQGRGGQLSAPPRAPRLVGRLLRSFREVRRNTI